MPVIWLAGNTYWLVQRAPMRSLSCGLERLGESCSTCLALGWCQDSRAGDGNAVTVRCQVGAGAALLVQSAGLLAELAGTVGLIGREVENLTLGARPA